MISRMRPAEHFRELVSEAMEHQRVRTDEAALHYLSDLLACFVTREKEPAEPLAIMYLKALGEGREMQARRMKELGDTSLFTAGFFPDSLSRSLVDVDYYTAMGRASYGRLAEMHASPNAKSPARTLFSELARKFTDFSDVLYEVSERCRLSSQRDILRVYERWLRTRSRLAERILRDAGIEPLALSTAPVH